MVQIAAELAVQVVEGWKIRLQRGVGVPGLGAREEQMLHGLFRGHELLSCHEAQHVDCVRHVLRACARTEQRRIRDLVHAHPISVRALKARARLA